MKTWEIALLIALPSIIALALLAVGALVVRAVRNWRARKEL